MAKILFMIDIEEGHLFPSFALARSLKGAGHEVLYVSIPDNEDFITNAGFNFYPLFEEHYPKGFRKHYKRMKKEKGLHHPVTVADHIEDLLSQRFCAFLNEVKPDLFIMSCFLNIEGLIFYYQNKIKPVMLRPFLREPGADICSDCIKDLMNLPAETTLKLFELTAALGCSFTSLAELAKPLGSFYELVICPKEFEMEGYKNGTYTYYLGSGIDQCRYADDLPFLRDIDVPVIYASLGSQAMAYSNLVELFFLKLTNVMSRPAMKDMHLVISIGPENSMEKFIPVSNNVTVVKWVSQMDILRTASLALVHGGLGTIKECIYHAVPMIIMPITHDQPSNGKRVEYHKLGLTLQITGVSEDELENKILQVLNSATIKENLKKMKHKFQEADNENKNLAIIEKLLPKKGIVI